MYLLVPYLRVKLPLGEYLLPLFVLEKFEGQRLEEEALFAGLVLPDIDLHDYSNDNDYNHMRSLILWIDSRRIASSFRKPYSFRSCSARLASGILCLLGSLIAFIRFSLNPVSYPSFLFSLSTSFSKFM